MCLEMVTDEDRIAQGYQEHLCAIVFPFSFRLGGMGLREALAKSAQANGSAVVERGERIKVL